MPGIVGAVMDTARASVRYMHAVGAATMHSRQPFIHILLSPAVPLVKYALPVAAILAIGHLTATDAMFVRMMADEDARLRLLAQSQQHRVQPGPPVQSPATVQSQADIT